jgi:hypothetical protein
MTILARPKLDYLKHSPLYHISTPYYQLFSKHLIFLTHKRPPIPQTHTNNTPKPPVYHHIRHLAKLHRKTRKQTAPKKTPNPNLPQKQPPQPQKIHRFLQKRHPTITRSQNSHVGWANGHHEI